MDDRAQAFTLEAVLAAVLLVASLAFALQATAVTPVSPSESTTNEAVQRASVAAGALDTTVANGAAKRALLAWNESSGGFVGATEEGYYVTGDPPTAFGETMHRTLSAESVAYNVDLVYLTPEGEYRTTALVDQGTPNDGATRVARTVTLHDDDRLTRLDGRERNVTVSETAFFAPNVDTDSDLYNVIRVEVTVWRS
ncbi:hypothetical protein [Halanaeroarchaeum sp. HSR-CO]|uniref:DUF7288 family protein n=1 Tax=Halanaeroarchaeum sp. HSR-CO TaxID=2866382 RepID=UPI00217E0B81|nr:hypothetical protein [Halanaeroarchaeum sp. HSR-CO]